MGRSLTLAQYVRRRNGVPLGHRRSLANMLDRSLGAGSLAGFWRHWNPIWSYGLGRYILAPLRRVFPASLALVLTFAVSGLLHDIVIAAIRMEITLLFTPWFLFVGLAVVSGEHFGWNFAGLPWAARAGINLACILVAFTLSQVTMTAIGLEL